VREIVTKALQAEPAAAQPIARAAAEVQP
jgi:hypothetical protein